MDKKIIIYTIWAVLVFLITFLQGASSDNITHFLILLFFALQFLALKFFEKIYNKFSPRTGFVFLSVLFACVVEGFYLISKPVFASLQITAATPINQIAINYFTDLLFTVPVYIVIFLCIWHFINKYKYELWEYVIFISLAQALGDGIAFFAAAPVMLLFLPYVMINYQAMNILPFLFAKPNLKPTTSSWKKYVLPVVSIIVIYFIGGLLIKIVGSFFGFS